MSICTLGLLKAGLTAQVVGGNTGGYTAGTSALSDAMLTDLLLEAEGQIQEAFGWRIEATHAVEIKQGSGTNRLMSRYYPIAYTNHIYIVSPSSSTQQTLVEVYNAVSVITFWELGSFLNYNPFVFQTAGYLTIFPSSSPVQLDYVYGYPMTTLAADAAQNATTLTLSSGLGFAPNNDYVIYDGTHTETVTTASTYTAGSTSLTLAAGTQYAHTAAATLAVTNMPFGVIRAARRIVERRVLGRDSLALSGVKSRKTGDAATLVESYVEVPEFSQSEIVRMAPNLNRRVGVV